MLLKQNAPIVATARAVQIVRSKQHDANQQYRPNQTVRSSQRRL